LNRFSGKPACFYMNAGCIQNENKNDERKELWLASLAEEDPVMEKLTLVANVGVDRNADTASQTNLALILGGVVYSLSDAVDIDFGVKGGLNDVAADYSLLAGLTVSILIDRHIEYAKTKIRKTKRELFF